MQKLRLSPKKKLRIFIESLRDNVKITEICQREKIWPRGYYRIKEKAFSRAMDAFKNFRRRKDVEKERLKRETQRLKNIPLISSRGDRPSKKKDQLGLLGPIFRL